MLPRNLPHFSDFMQSKKASCDIPATIIIFRNRCSNKMNNNEALSVDDDDDDDDNDAADDNDGPSTLKKLIFANGSIFEDDMIEKYTTETGQSRWKCKWCNNSFAVWNATKAIYHVNKISKDICPCTARIDSDHVSKYKAFYEVITKKRSRGLKTTDHLDRSMSSHNLITASTLDSD